MSRYLVSVKLAPCSQTKADIVRAAGEVVERDGVWYESFAPGCFARNGRDAEVSIGHDTESVGSVVTVVAKGDLFYADMVVESDDPQVLARIRPGTPVSLGARSLVSDADHHLRLKRHLVCELEHVAIAAPHQVGCFPGAKITSVTETTLARTKPTSLATINWRELLPAEYADFAECFDGDDPPLGVLSIGNRKVGIRWDGRRFVSAAA